MEFDECIRLGDEDIKRILEALPRDTFVNAIAGASPDIKQRFYDNLSPKAVQMIEQDLKQLDSTSGSDAARQEVVAAALALTSRGSS